MKAVNTLLFLAASIGDSSAFAPQLQTKKTVSLSMRLDDDSSAVSSSRRAALLSIGNSAAAFTIASSAIAPPNAAFAADESAEDMVKRIAAQSAAANEAARIKAEKDNATKKAKTAEGSSNLVLGAGAAGVALTLPFFLPNLLRLGTKLSSGGENDGYGARKRK